MGNQIAYSFDQVVGSKVYDQSGYLYHLDLTGGVPGQGHDEAGATGGMDSSGGGGRAQIYSGGSSAVVAGLASSDFGLMAWVRSHPGASGEQVLFHCGPAEGTGVDTLTVYAAASDGNVRVRRNSVTYTTSVSVLDGEWHHVSVQGGGDVPEMRIKVDDVLVGGSTPGVPVGALSSPATTIPWIGVGQTVGGTLVFDGVIDDVRILNDPIDSLAHATSNELFMDTPVYNQLMCEYGFREGGGALAADTSGWGRDMALTDTDQWLVSGYHGGAINPGNGAAAGMGNAFGLADADLVHTDRSTVLFWLYVPATANGGVYTLFDVRDASGNLRFEALMIADGTSTASVYLRIYTPTFTQWAGSININITTGQWNHIAVAIYPTGWQPYRNGEIYTGADSQATNPLPGWERLRIGAGRFPAPTVAAGIRLDDLRIINNYIYPEGIAKHMAAESGAPPTAVLASVDAAWNVAGTVTKTTDSRWGVARLLATTTDSTWDVASLVALTAPSAWQLRATIDQAVAVAWNVNGIIVKTADSRWAVAGAVATAVASTWHLRANVGQAVASTWNVNADTGAGTVTVLTAAAWSIRRTITRTVVCRWHVATDDGDGETTTPPERTLYVPRESRTLHVLPDDTAIPPWPQEPTMTDTFLHAPGAELDYAADLTDWLVDGDTLADATWTVPAGLTQPKDPTHDTTRAVVWLGGGVHGLDYQATVAITTTAGRKDSRTITLRCRRR